MGQLPEHFEDLNYQENLYAFTDILQGRGIINDHEASRLQNFINGGYGSDTNVADIALSADYLYMKLESFMGNEEIKISSSMESYETKEAAQKILDDPELQQISKELQNIIPDTRTAYLQDHPELEAISEAYDNFSHFIKYPMALYGVDTSLAAKDPKYKEQLSNEHDEIIQYLKEGIENSHTIEEMLANGQTAELLEFMDTLVGDPPSFSDLDNHFGGSTAPNTLNIAIPENTQTIIDNALKF